MMTLFDTTEILHAGEKKEVDFTVPGATLKLWEQFFQKEESDRYYRLLLRTTPWAQHRRKMYDKIVADPRLTAWYGKNGNEWTAELLEIKKKVETASGIVFDSV